MKTDMFQYQWPWNTNSEFRNGAFPAISINKDAANHQKIAALQGTQEGEQYLLSSSHQAAATPYSEHWRKTQDAGPRCWDACEGNGFSEPTLLHLPTQRKALNSFTWKTWFSLIHNNLFMFRRPALCCKFLNNVTPPCDLPAQSRSLRVA